MTSCVRITKQLLENVIIVLMPVSKVVSHSLAVAVSSFSLSCRMSVGTSVGRVMLTRVMQQYAKPSRLPSGTDGRQICICMIMHDYACINYKSNKCIFISHAELKQQCGAMESLITWIFLVETGRGIFQGSILDGHEWRINRQRQLKGCTERCCLCGLWGEDKLRLSLWPRIQIGDPPSHIHVTPTLFLSDESLDHYCLLEYSLRIVNSVSRQSMHYTL